MADRRTAPSFCAWLLRDAPIARCSHSDPAIAGPQCCRNHCHCPCRDAPTHRLGDTVRHSNRPLLFYRHNQQYHDMDASGRHATSCWEHRSRDDTTDARCGSDCGSRSPSSCHDSSGSSTQGHLCVERQLGVVFTPSPPQPSPPASLLPFIVYSLLSHGRFHLAVHSLLPAGSLPAGVAARARGSCETEVRGELKGSHCQE